jgi:hypothetical protein
VSCLRATPGKRLRCLIVRAACHAVDGMAAACTLRGTRARWAGEAKRASDSSAASRVRAHTARTNAAPDCDRARELGDTLRSRDSAIPRRIRRARGRGDSCAKRVRLVGCCKTYSRSDVTAECGLTKLLGESSGNGKVGLNNSDGCRPPQPFRATAGVRLIESHTVPGKLFSACSPALLRHRTVPVIPIRTLSET